MTTVPSGLVVVTVRVDFALPEEIDVEVEVDLDLDLESDFLELFDFDDDEELLYTTLPSEL